jgi:hypothetical protein
MFIKNFNSIDKNNILLVDEKTKCYLMSIGYPPLSNDDDKWIYRKSIDLINIINAIEEGGE